MNWVRHGSSATFENEVELLPRSTAKLAVLHGSKRRATTVLKSNLIRSIEFGTAVARRLKQALRNNDKTPLDGDEKHSLSYCVQLNWCFSAACGITSNIRGTVFLKKKPNQRGKINKYHLHFPHVQLQTLGFSALRCPERFMGRRISNRWGWYFMYALRMMSLAGWSVLESKKDYRQLVGTLFRK